MLFLPTLIEQGWKEQQNASYCHAAALCRGVCGLEFRSQFRNPEKESGSQSQADRQGASSRAFTGGSGFYAGINGGYSWGRATLREFSFFENTINARNGMAGVTFGYNAQSGSVVYGVETDIDAAWMTTNWGAPPCFACEIQLRYFGTLRGRLGYAVGKALPYITAGLAYGSLSTASLVSGTTETETKFGWTAGAGVEYAMFGAWSVNAEYLYFELDRMTCGTLTCGSEVEVKLKGNLVRTGFNYRF